MNLQKKDAINKFPLFISNINENENKKEEDKNSHSIDDLFKKNNKNNINIFNITNDKKGIFDLRIQIIKISQILIHNKNNNNNKNESNSNTSLFRNNTSNIFNNNPSSKSKNLFANIFADKQFTK